MNGMTESVASAIERPQLKSSQFRRDRRAGWQELETLVERAERDGIESLDAADLHRLPILYRNALSSLSVARAISLDRNLLEYLENLCARAYLSVYVLRRDLGHLLIERHSPTKLHSRHD